MRILLTLCFVLAALPRVVAQQQANESTLTLVNDVSFNQMSITVSLPLFGEDKKNSALSGSIEATTNISPSTGQSNELTLVSGTLSADPVNFSLGNFLTGYATLNASNLGVGINTPLAPGLLTPSTGIFNASEHAFTINQGRITGTIPGSSVPMDINFADIPVTGTGSGNGTFSITEDGRTSTRITYTVILTMPVTATKLVPTGVVIGDTELMATVTFKATIKATSTVFVYLSAYLQWTEENNHPGVDFTATDFGEIPNGLLWALGYGSGVLPQEIIHYSSGRFTISLPDGGTTSKTVIEFSPDLKSWQPAENNQISTGSSTIPTGSTGTIVITPNAPSGFYRVVAPK